ncbi:MAG TPA: HAMP domain-containing sensor histidine kinase [Acidiferrobacterales bacterium]|nr:HAMP domain-containing sensor histidine kinase [Acidiferrobacterales bacterium]
MKCRRFRDSLSGRLTLLFVGMAVLFVLLVGAGIGRAFHDHFNQTLRPHLQRYAEYIRHDIGMPPNLARAAALSRELPVIIQIAGPDGVWVSRGEPADLGALELRSRRIARDLSNDYRFGELDGNEYFVLRDGAYTFAFSVPGGKPAYRYLWPLAALLLVLALLYHATRWLISPIGRIQAGVERIGAGELDHRIELSRRDELGDLAHSINGMADEIRRMLEAKRQLLLAISHELRSPLTRAKVAVALLDDPRQRAEISRDLDELARLVEELLETERLTTRHRILDRRPVSLNALVEEVIASFFAGAGVRRTLPAQDVQAEVDSARIKLLLKNLLDNAVRHTSAGAAPPEVTLSATPEGVALSVRDHGAGIAPEHLPHLTEPFYRADPARRRETGGYGLGLYLCRVIAEAHGGTLAIDSAPGQGTTVRVMLPRHDNAHG